jgi:hypothetical protein
MRSGAMALRKTIGRCPDCGSRVQVQRVVGRPGMVLPHGCLVRACEYPACRAIGLPEQMAQLGREAWYWRSHGLLVVAEQLVALHEVASYANRTAIPRNSG